MVVLSTDLHLDGLWWVSTRVSYPLLVLTEPLPILESWYWRLETGDWRLVLESWFWRLETGTGELVLETGDWRLGSWCAPEAGWLRTEFWVGGGFCYIAAFPRAPLRGGGGSLSNSKLKLENEKKMLFLQSKKMGEAFLTMSFN